jgi:hypothetical protein
VGGAGEVGGWVEGSAAVERQKAKENSTEWPWRRSAAMQRPKRKQINRKAKQNGTCTLGHTHKKKWRAYIRRSAEVEGKDNVQ